VQPHNSSRAIAARARETTSTTLEEFEEAARLSAGETTPLQGRGGNLPQVAHRRIECAEGAPNLIDDFPLQPPAPQADHIQADDRIAFRGQRKRCDVTRDARATTDHGALADTAKLVDDRAAAQKGAIANLNVPGQ